MTLPFMDGLGVLPLADKVRRLASSLRRKLVPVSRAARPHPIAETLDLSAPEVVANPFPHYEELARSGPVHYLPQNGFWLVIGYEEVQAALSKPQVFSNRVQDWMAVDSVLLGADPPQHTAVRRAVTRLFSAESLDAQAAFAESSAERLLRPLVEGRALDVLREFTSPLSEEVAAHLVGFDEATLAAIRAAQEGASDLGEWLDALNAVIGEAAVRTHAYGKLMRDGEGVLSHEEVLSLLRFLWLAGTTTTRRVLASSVLMLLRNLPARAQVESDTALLPAFVEETLRMHPPEHTISRVAACKVEMSGAIIPAGAWVKLCMGAANRDSSRFDDHSSFLLQRAPNRHLSFGGGIHRCLGASLARVEMTAALRVLLRLAPRFRSAQPLETLRFVGFTNDTEQLLIES